MGQFLHKLGKYAYNHGWRVLGLWAVVVALLAVGAVQFMKPPTSSISIPGTEAQRALDTMSDLFPDAGKGSARVVFEAPAGKSIEDYKSEIDKTTKEITDVEGVSGAISPFLNTAAISENKSIAYLQVQLKDGNGSVGEETTEGVKKAVEAARAEGLTVEMGGDVVNRAPSDILGIGEVVGVVVALLVLLMTLGSLVAAGMPLITALVAFGAGVAGLFSLSQVIEISSTTPVLAVMLGLAVGIDYSLFIINKYRSYLLEGYGYEAAATRALGTAGNAVIFAAATVVIALSALAVVNIPFMTTMGLAGAATVALAAIAAVTLIPALLGFAGASIFRGKTKRAIEKAQKKGPKDAHKVDHKTFWYKWGEVLVRRPLLVLVAAVIVLAGIALPARDLKLGLPSDGHAAESTTERKAYDLLTKGFGDGFNGPLIIVADGVPVVTDADREAVRKPMMKEYQRQVADARAKSEAQFQQRAMSVTTPEEYMQLQQDITAAKAEGARQQKKAEAEIEARVAQYATLNQLNLIAERIAKLEDVQKAQPAMATDDGTKGIIQVIPKSAPSSQETLDLITYLRDPGHQEALAGSGDVTFGVTGSTALQSDIEKKLADALPMYLAVIVGLSLVLLVVAFRSILVPLKATLGFLLSVLAMFGALVAVFQWGWFGIAEAPAPIMSFLPIIAIGILFGLAMDYEFFLVSSMHEAHEHTKDAKRAVVSGFGLGSKVVAAAGVIMVAVFSGFIANHDETVQAIGFGLAVGILVDAFIVRMTIVPAVMALLGSKAWWIPRWLDRILPHVSIEGEDSKPIK